MKRRRDPRYQKLLNSKRWKETKAIVWRRAEGLCERCAAQGFIRAGVDCHHIIPIESCKTVEEMERLCFDPNNIQLLCVPCHQEVHRLMGKNTTANRKKRRDESMERWIEHLKNLGNNE